MNITIKQLQGGECALEVFPTTKILDIKQQIATKLKIPILEQKLLLLGRALNDEQTVQSYPSIKNGTKLNLVVKKPDGIIEAATKYFKSGGITETEARAKAHIFVKTLEDNFAKLSWDDIERLSIDCMLDENGRLLDSENQENECDYDEFEP
ncbi:ubiquitin-like protein 4A-A [Pararge aegeria]|uniref:Jg21733 protein n=2 Tax=Pararge aegeria TaxID=116150 RepID=A0A8S4S9A9_9NEOP|nr:ubiquitin-like protein 4A-A [Pararge aegeria]CAH2249156.1 jg21733 [Pararge aegeria aegeria]